MSRYLNVVAAALLIAACGDTTTSSSPAATLAATTAPSHASNSQRAAGLNGRTGELLNPESSTVVFLYYDLAGISPPIDTWVEDDNRVKFAQGGGCRVPRSRAVREPSVWPSIERPLATRK